MSQTEEKKGIGRRVQAFGPFLSSMIMPNTGAFIAWGPIAAILIDSGWLSNKDLTTLAGPMITYLIPLLTAFSGGRLIYDLRGGIIAATVTTGVIVALPDTPVSLDAMIMGPLAGWLMKRTDQLTQPRTPQSFEVLLNNFSAGILEFIMTTAEFKILAPLTRFIIHVLSVAVEALVHAHLLPLVNTLVGPVKIMFLNNATNHGIFTPFGAGQVVKAGRSILYTTESNPGSGLGILPVYMIFGGDTAKATSYGAGIIHFLGGIHEIYFPYVLMRPLSFIAAILDGMTGAVTYQVTGFGFKSPTPPDSSIVYCLNAPRGEFLYMLLGVFLAALVSFVVAALIVKLTRESKQDLEAATAQMENTKGKKPSVVSKLVSSDKNVNIEESASGSVSETSSSDDDPEALLDNYNTEDVDAHNYNNIDHVIFACDAGMGSNAMGASMLCNKFKKAGTNDITVTNIAINQLLKDAQLAITQKKLADRVIKQTPNATHISVDNSLNSPGCEGLSNNLKKDDQA